MKGTVSLPFIPRGFGNAPSARDTNRGAVIRGNLFSWGHSNFTKPENYKEGEPFKFIVHTVDVKGSPEVSRQLLNGHSGLLTTWDTMSVSVISEQKPFTYGSLGVILEVPAQNVILTLPEDMMFRNNIGDVKRAAFDLLKDRIPTNPIIRSGQLSRHIMACSTKSEVRTPNELLSKTFYAHNEIIIAPRPNVNIHPGFPVTGMVRIIGVFKRDVSNTNPLRTAIENMFKSAARSNLPVINIPGFGDQQAG